MLHINTLAQAKKTARALEKALTSAGITLQHGKALDALAAMCGQGDWNSFKASLSVESLDKKLFDFELSHIEGTDGDEYGQESSLVAHTGFSLRYSATDELCDYVRVCDPLGRELMYWTSSEWAEDSECVMGAILGALVRGKPVNLPRPQKVTKRSPAIQDIDFSRLTCIIRGGQRLAVEVVENQALSYLANPSLVVDRNRDIVGNLEVLQVCTRDRDGFESMETVYAEELLDLTWSDEQKAFFNKAGERYDFYFEQSMESWFAQRSARLETSQEPAHDMKHRGEPAAAVEDPPLRLFSFTANSAPKDAKYPSWTANPPVVRMAIRSRIAAVSGDDLEQRIRDEWSSVELSDINFSPCPEDQAGPFTVYVDGGRYDTVPYLKQARDVAELVLETAKEEVTVEDVDRNQIWTVKP